MAVRGKTPIWTVGGGKGGVGKTLITSNLGILLSRKSVRVLLVDADLGAANLHTLLRCEERRPSLSSFMCGDVNDISDIICRTEIPNLHIIAGAQDTLDVVETSEIELARLEKALEAVDYDLVIMDVGPGTSTNMLDLFLISENGIIVTTPERTAIENTYRFIKALLLRRVKQTVSSGEDRDTRMLLQSLLAGSEGRRVRTIAALFNVLKDLDSGGNGIIRKVLGGREFSLIINQTRGRDDERIGILMKHACYDFFGIDIDYLGHINYDKSVTDSVRTRRYLTVDYASSRAAKAIGKVAEMLIRNNRKALSI